MRTTGPSRRSAALSPPEAEGEDAAEEPAPLGAHALPAHAPERHATPAQMVVAAGQMQRLGLGRQREPVGADQRELQLPAVLLGASTLDGAASLRILAPQAPPLGHECGGLAEGFLLAVKRLERDHAGRCVLL